MRFYFDVETMEKHEDGKWYPVLDTRKFVMGGIRGQGKSEIYYDKEQMKERMLLITKNNKKYKKTTVFYAHNAKYDWYALFTKEIIAGEFKRIKKDPLICEHIPSGMKIICTMNFMKEKLSEIGEKLGMPKGQLKESYADLKECEEYLHRDTEIIEKLVEYIIAQGKKLGITIKTPYTASQIAVAYYLHWITKVERSAYDILELRGREGYHFVRTKYDDFIRKAYKGGNNIAYQTGIFEELTEYDQNAQYPYTLSQMEIPNLRQERKLKNPLKYINKKDFLNNYIGVCKAKVDTYEHKGTGVLSINFKGYQIIPTEGELQGYWTISELRKAEEEGYNIIKIEEAVYYPKSNKNPFTNYFKTLYKMRKQEPETELFIKLLMNGLIGKFGQKYNEVDEIIDTADKTNQYKLEGYTVKGELLNKLVFEKKGKTIIPNFGCIMIATECLAQAKVQMYDYLNMIPKKDLIYHDTDNVVCKGDHKQEFQPYLGLGMGQFKIKRDKKKGEIIKEKVYEIDKEYKISGLGKAQIKEITDKGLDLFEEIREGRTNSNKMIGLDEAMKMGRIESIGTFENYTYSISEQTKRTIELPYIIQDDKWEENETLK